MAAPNQGAIFSRVADIQFAESIVTAHNVVDLTSGTSYLVFTADATNGGFVRDLRIKVSPAASSAATVGRIWLNNGAALGTASNSVLIGELGLPATTTSATTALPDFAYPLGIALPPGWRIYFTVATAPGGSAELNVTAFGGKY